MSDYKESYRLMAMYSDGTSEVFDVELLHRDAKHYLTQSYQKFHKAELVVSINLKTGETDVLKNRYGNQGPVYRVVA